MLENFKVLVNLVKNGETAYHQDYKYTVDLASKLKAFYTGDAEGLLKKFNLRESQEEFENRKKLTSFITPAIIRKCETPFSKTLRLDGIKSVIEPQDKEALIVNNFDGGLSIDAFQEQKTSRLRGCDPNAWVVVDYKDYDHQIEKAKPYPIIYNSHNALDYKYDLGDLVYLITNEIGGYNMWMKEEGYKLREVPQDDIKGRTVKSWDQIQKLEEVPENGTILKIDKYYEFKIFTHRVDKVPAYRVGYRFDIATDNRTYESYIHAAIPRIDKTIKTDSERDIAFAMHVFPQKVISVKDCGGDSTGKCSGGWVTNREGKRSQCTTCGGSAEVPLHKSTQDIIQVNNPLDSGVEQLDLSKVIHYVPSDVATPSLLNEYLQFLEDQCFKDVHSSNVNSISTGSKTATESNIDYEAMHNVLFSFTQSISQERKFLVDVIAQLKDEKLETNQHAFPSDLNLQTFKELLEEYKQSDTAPEFVRIDLIKKMGRKLNSQTPEDQLKFLVKLQHDPFASKTSAEKQYLISSGLATDTIKAFYAYSEKIFFELEQEVEDFYLRSYDQRKALIDAKLDVIAKELFTQVVPLAPLGIEAKTA